SKGRKFVYMLRLSVFVVSVCSYAFISSIVLLFVMRIAQGIGWGFSTTATGTIASDLIPPKRRGEGMGYCGLSGNLALAFGPALGLTLVDLISFSQLFLICSISCLVAVLLSSKIRYVRVEKAPHKMVTVKFDIFEKTAVQASVLLYVITVKFGGITTFLTLYAT